MRVSGGALTLIQLFNGRQRSRVKQRISEPQHWTLDISGNPANHHMMCCFLDGMLYNRHTLRG